MKDRQTSNLLILTILSDYLKKYPDIRFSQALLNLNIVKQLDVQPRHPNDWPDQRWADEFYLEPEDLLKRIKA